MLACHNTLSISYSPPHSPVSYSKLNSSHPEDCFTHGFIWMPSPTVCYLVSCSDIALYGHSVCQYSSVGKVITTARAEFPAPGGNSFPLFVQSTTHHTYAHHSQGYLLSICSNQSLYRILACQSRAPVINSLITSLSLQTHFPHATPVSVTLYCN